MNIATLEGRTKLRFADPLHVGETYSAPEALAEHAPLTTARDITW